MADAAHLNPGDARCPGPSTGDILRADTMPPPAVVTDECYAFAGDQDVSYDVYTSREYAALEEERMWSKTWQFACRVEHIPNSGDSFAYDVGRYSILVIRQSDRSIRAFRNSCKHRGMQLQRSGTTDSLKVIRCPFHGWTWKPNGELLSIPCAWDFPHANADSHRLDAVLVETWGGFVFVNLDLHAPPLLDYLEILPAHFQHWPLEKRHLVLHIEKKLPANWKIALEAFLEAYHVMATHPQGLMTASDANAQYDIYGANVSRFVHTIGVQSPHLNTFQDEAKMLRNLGGEALGLELAPGQTARDCFAAYLRTALGDQMQVDLSHYSTSEMIDSIEYYCFPNLVMFPGIGLPMVYRFRPDGDDVDACIFDLMFLAITPDGSTIASAPEPIRLDVATSFADVGDMDPKLAYIYDQDVDNLARLTRGIKASAKSGQTLGNYQEARIRAMRDTLARYVGAR